MDAELKAKWVEALRSGKYKQGRLKLRQELNGQKQFCCLGVLCEITPGLKYDRESNSYSATNKLKKEVDSDAVNTYQATLQEGLVEHFGLNKAVVIDHETTRLVDKLMLMNDGIGRNFNQIANYIERTKF